MNDFKSFAMQILRQNPNIMNNPQLQHMISVVQNGDSQQGQQIAENLCKTYGISKEDAIQQAKQFFGMR